MSSINWFENPTFDAPELKSPQPCIHGAGCVYTKTLPDGKIVPAVCRYVHPGEEGKGRRLYSARTVVFEHPDGKDVVDQPACVRLIGNALYYERMRMQMPWQGFCAVRGIPFTPNKPGVFREPVRRVPIGSPRVVAPTNEQRQREIVGKFVSLSAELSSLMGPAPVSAVATAEQSWPVLGGGGGGGALQREKAADEVRAVGGHDDEAYSDYDDCSQKMRGKRPYAYKRYVNEQKETARLGVWAAKAAAAFTAEAAKAAEQAVPDSTAPEQAEPDCTAPEQAAARLGVALNVAAAAEAAAIAAQSEQQKAARWAKQLEYARAHKIYVTQQRAAQEATRLRQQEIDARRVAAGEWVPGMTTLLKPIPHAVVESEVIAASQPPQTPHDDCL